MIASLDLAIVNRDPAFVSLDLGIVNRDPAFVSLDLGIVNLDPVRANRDLAFVSLDLTIASLDLAFAEAGWERKENRSAPDAWERADLLQGALLRRKQREFLSGLNRAYCLDDRRATRKPKGNLTHPSV